MFFTSFLTNINSSISFSIVRIKLQLSLRTVSIPLVSILSYLFSFVQYKPAYLFLFNNKYG